MSLLLLFQSQNATGVGQAPLGEFPDDMSVYARGAASRLDLSFSSSGAADQRGELAEAPADLAAFRARRLTEAGFAVEPPGAQQGVAPEAELGPAQLFARARALPQDHSWTAPAAAPATPSPALPEALAKPRVLPQDWELVPRADQRTPAPALPEPFARARSLDLTHTAEPLASGFGAVPRAELADGVLFRRAQVLGFEFSPLTTTTVKTGGGGIDEKAQWLRREQARIVRRRDEEVLLLALLAEHEANDW